jgi:hypothetical protein
MRKRSASGSTVSNDISPKLSSSSKEENSVDDEWRKDDRRYPSKTFCIIFHALLNCRRVKRVEEEYTTLLAICPLSSILYRLMIMYGCVLAHSVAQWWRWWLGFFFSFIFLYPNGRAQSPWLLVPCEGERASLMSVFRPLESVPRCVTKTYIY